MPETKYNADVYVTNSSGSRAFVEFTYQYGDKDPITRKMYLNHTQTMGEIPVAFGEDKKLNFWSVTLTIGEGENKDIYKNIPQKFSSPLSGADSGHKRVEVFITTEKMTIQRSSKKNTNEFKTSTEMVRVGPLAKIKHVFVLMLENHSFDHLLGFADLAGRDPVTKESTELFGLKGTETNIHREDTYPGGVKTVKETTYTVKKRSVDPMTRDAGHEFIDTFQQICGQDAVWDKTKPYPGPQKTDMSGFAANYATSTTEQPKQVPDVPHRGDTMACCEPWQVNALYTLAKEYAVCDMWFSSMPGPTWPNRFFAMAGTSNGLDDSPGMTQSINFSKLSGISFENGSIFRRVGAKGSRIYNDHDNEFATDPANWHFGATPIAGALNDVGASSINAFKNFAKELKEGIDDVLTEWVSDPDSPIPEPVYTKVHRDYTDVFTWIEPHYGSASNSYFVGGSSQHPMDSLTGGDKLVAATYKAIRNSPLWKDSLLIITYDEHGGFYDHVPPPKTAYPPGGKNDLNKHGFDFTRLGVRVPAVVVSPYIPKGTIDHTVYDHTTIIKTTCEAFGLQGLTNRDKNANSLLHLLYGKLRSEDDCPREVTPATGIPPAAARGTGGAAAIEGLTDSDRLPVDGPADNEPLPESGNIWGFLQIAAKIDFELSDRTEAKRAEILARLKTIKTYGQAREYFREVEAKLKAYREVKDKAI